jgi:hypothetical protein
MLHDNNVGITYARTSNFRMEIIRYVPLYSMAMSQSMVIVTETPFVTAPTHTIVGMKFRPQTPRGTKHVNVHTKMPREVNKFFCWLTIRFKRRWIKPIKTTKTFRTFRIFWIANDESKQTAITTKHVLSLAT